MSSLRLLNKTRIILRWMDLDAYGHMGNARYFDFMTDARVDLLNHVGFIDDLSMQYVAADAQCSFKSPCFYPGTLVVEQYCGHVGNTSFSLHYRFYMESAPEILCAEGKIVIVCYDAKAQKPVPLEPIIRQLLLGEQAE